MRLIFFIILLYLNPSVTMAEVINFQCSWDENKPLKISVDTESGKATRDDGGKSYSVIKATKYGVWLSLNEPENIMGLAVQFIQRKEFIKPDKSSEAWSKAGKWVDIVMSAGGAVSAIDGGKCWEE